MTGTNLDSLSALRWLVDAGADEAIGEHAIDRFAPPTLRETVKSPPMPVRERVQIAAPKNTSPPPPTAQANGDDAIGEAQHVARSCNTLADLRAALEGFEGSQLKKNAKRTVFADGNPASRILLIGEAPGRDEDREGLPFVGRAGKLLDLMLAAIGLGRSSVYITNVMPWRPPDNRNPEATEVAICLPFLRRHIELAAPRIMMLLGSTSLRHVLGNAEGILRNRGRWMEYRVGEENIPVMPTLHPAYLLREPAHKKLAWRDLQSFAEKIEQMKLR